LYHRIPDTACPAGRGLVGRGSCRYAIASAANRANNQPLQRTGRASRSLWLHERSRAHPAAERRSVMRLREHR
jgi:hypothetical protein